MLVPDIFLSVESGNAAKYQPRRRFPSGRDIGDDVRRDWLINMRVETRRAAPRDELLATAFHVLLSRPRNPGISVRIPCAGSPIM